jgi:hypothetical protein
MTETPPVQGAIPGDPSANAADAEAVVGAFKALVELAAADADLARRGRFLTCEVEIGVGSVPLAVSIIEGRVMSVRQGPFLLKPWTFAIRADADVWRRFHEPYPAPGFHDLMALTKVGKATIEGNLVPFMGNLQYVKDLLALPRRLRDQGGKP